VVKLKAEVKELREGLLKIGKLETEVGKCKTKCGAIDRRIKEMEAAAKESKKENEHLLEKERRV
jgi:septal ring factor EnvC (AmiA/AmiB activator)